MKYVYSLLLSLLAFTAVAEPLTANSEKIKEAYRLYQNNPAYAEPQMNFIRSFPATKEAFLEVFLPANREQLYDNRQDYMDVLVKLSKVYPQDVLARIMGVGKEMLGAGDVTGQLQNLTIDLAVTYTAEFSRVLSSWKKKNDQLSLMVFLTDTDEREESLKVLADNLRALGENKQAMMLENMHDEAKKKSSE